MSWNIQITRYNGHRCRYADGDISSFVLGPKLKGGCHGTTANTGEWNPASFHLLLLKTCRESAASTATREHDLCTWRSQGTFRQQSLSAKNCLYIRLEPGDGSLSRSETGRFDIIIFPCSSIWRISINLANRGWSLNLGEIVGLFRLSTH